MATDTPQILPGWLNQRRAALSSGVSTKSFAEWRVEPVARIGRETFYTVEAIIANRLARQAERFEESTSPVDREAADREKTLLTREQRIGQELKNAQTRRELAPVELITWTLSNIGSQISAILESISLKVKKLLPKMTAAEIEHIKREVVKAQNAAARVTVDLDEYYDRDRAADGQASEPMGAGL